MTTSIPSVEVTWNFRVSPVQEGEEKSFQDEVTEQSWVFRERQTQVFTPQPLQVWAGWSLVAWVQPPNARSGTGCVRGESGQEGAVAAGMLTWVLVENA